MNPFRSWFVMALLLFAAASRLVPHPPNFAPLAAVALFGAATLEGRWSAWLVPVGALLSSDLLLHLTYLAGWQPHWGFYQGQWVVYLCALATAGIGLLIRRRRTVATVVLASLASSVVFFLVTNFACVFEPQSIYPRTIHGLFLSYEAALPFFRNGLAGDLFYSAVLFGALSAAETRFPALAPRPSVAPREPAFEGTP